MRASPVSKLRRDQGTLESLFAIIDKGTRQQRNCSGKYDLDAQQGPMGYPRWKHSRLDLWIYKGTGGSWLISDKDRDANSDCNQGHFQSSCEAHPDAPPHKVEWEIWDEDQDAWVATTALWIRLGINCDGNPSNMYVYIPETRLRSRLCNGCYGIVKEQGSAKHPSWKLAIHDAWLHKRTDSMWCVSFKADCNAMDPANLFGYMYSPGGNRESFPHEFEDQWAWVVPDSGFIPTKILVSDNECEFERWVRYDEDGGWILRSTTGTAPLQ